MKRTLCDQHFSRRICALADVVINTGEDNYLTTADAVEAAHTVVASQFINEAFARHAGLPDELMGLQLGALTLVTEKGAECLHQVPFEPVVVNP